MTSSRVSTTLILRLCLLLCVGPVAAHATSPALRDPPPASAATSGAEVYASKLVGSAVADARGKRLGTIRDVIVDTNSGRVHYAILAFGGAMGAAKKLYAVPVTQLQRSGKRGLVLPVDRDRLAAMPAFDARRWPDWQSDTYRTQVDRHFQLPPAEANARYRRASDLIKATVRDSHGGKIGQVRDLVLDLPASRATHVVVSFDRAWNPRNKTLLLPMNAFADGATTQWKRPASSAAAPPRNTSPTLALENPSGEPSKGTASAVNPPGSVPTRPPALKDERVVQQVAREPLKTTTSYADDEGLVYKGAREDLRDAPAFDPKRALR